LKPAANTSATRILNHPQAALVVAASRVPRLPGYVWLAMIIIAAAALSFGTIARARGEMRQARTAHAQAHAQVKLVESANELLKSRLQNLQQDHRAIERAAQDRLNYVRPNEVVVSTR
jgi:cell division protein FtsB